MRGNTSTSQLAVALTAMIRKQAGSLDQVMDQVDLGTIQADSSLRVDRFLKPFPPDQYWVVEGLQLPDPLVTTAAATVGDHGDHTHDVPRPESRRPLAPGDRVLVVWMTTVDPLVVDRVMRSGL